MEGVAEGKEREWIREEFAIIRPPRHNLWICLCICCIALCSRLNCVGSHLCVKIGPWVWPGGDPEKKKEKKGHTRSIFGHISPRRGGATGYPIGIKFGVLVGPLHLITPANFSLGRLIIGSVVIHESLICFRNSALHRLSPLTQLGPAGPLVITNLYVNRK